MDIIAIIISIVALVLAGLAYKNSKQKPNLFVKEGNGYWTIVDNNDQEILTITKL